MKHDPGLITAPAIHAYAESMSTRASEVLEDIALATEQQVASAHMLSGILVGNLLKILVQLARAKVVLDIGTFTGYSALTLAESLADDGKVYTCEWDIKMLKLAQRFWQQSPDAHKIESVINDGLEFLSATPLKFDLIFLDADKGRLLDYYETALTKLNQGGLIVIDDVLWRGEVLTPESSKAKLLDQLNRHIAQDSRVINVLLPVRHGLQVIFYPGVAVQRTPDISIL